MPSAWGVRRALPWRCLALLASLSLVVGVSGCSGGSGETEVYSVQLLWDAPIENADGSPLNDLQGFKVYDGTQPGQYDSFADVGTSTEFSLDGLSAGTYYITVAAFDTSGNESAYANEIAVTVP